MKNGKKTLILALILMLNVSLAFAETYTDVKRERDVLLNSLPAKTGGIKLLAFYIHGFELGEAYGCENTPNLSYWQASDGNEHSFLTLYAEKSDQVKTYVAAWCSEKRLLEGDDPQATRTANQLHAFNKLHNPHLYNGDTPLASDPDPAKTIPMVVFTHSTGGLVVVKVGQHPINVFSIINFASAVGGTNGAATLKLLNGDKLVLDDLDKATDSTFGHQPARRIDGKNVPTTFIGSVVSAGQSSAGGIMGAVTNSGAAAFTNQPNDGVLAAHSTGGAQQEYSFESTQWFCYGECYRKEARDYVFAEHISFEVISKQECGPWWWSSCKTVQEVKHQGLIPGAEVKYLSSISGEVQTNAEGIVSTDVHDHYNIYKNSADPLYVGAIAINAAAQKAGLK